MNKKVIFIGGTSYSGTTFFDMILGNDPEGFSCGELASYLYSRQKHHLNSICGCGDKKCQVWNKICNEGTDNDNIYKSIFKNNENIKFIVDSSKNPYWIYHQGDQLKKSGIDVVNLLIWKTPMEIFASFKKRGRESVCKKKWINYHRRYMSFIDNFVTISYNKIANNNEYLKYICDYLQINYFDNKHKYWLKTHHTLFGNKNAKAFLYYKENGYKSVINEIPRSYSIQNHFKSEHRKPCIYYDKGDDSDKSYLLIEKNKFFKFIIKELLKNDIKKYIMNDKIKTHKSINKKIKYNFINKSFYILYLKMKRAHFF